MFYIFIPGVNFISVLFNYNRLFICAKFLFPIHTLVNLTLSPAFWVWEYQYMRLVFYKSTQLWVTSSWTEHIHCHVSLFKLNIKLAETWTVFSNNVNTTIRKYSSRAFIWVVTPLGFVGQLRIYKFSWFSQIHLWQHLDQGLTQTWTLFRCHLLLELLKMST